MVLVEALDAFVTFLPDGEPVSCIRGECVQLPKAVADKLVKGKLAKLVGQPEPPQNKTAGPAPEVKVRKPRTPAKKAAPAAD